MLCLTLSNHTVIIHTRYQDTSPILDVLWLALEPVRFPVSVARTFHHNLPSTILGKYPITVVACFEWTMRYQAWRSPSHVSQPYPFTPTGALARFIPPRRQSVHERDALTVWRQLCMTKVFEHNLYYCWIFPLPMVVEAMPGLVHVRGSRFCSDVPPAMAQTFRHGVLSMLLIKPWGAHGWGT